MAVRDLAITAYRAAAEEAYTSGSKLEDKVLRIDGVIGDTQRFPVIGPLDADDAEGTDPVLAQALSDAKPVANLSPKESFARIRQTDTFFTNVGYARVLGRQTSMGVGRRKDQDIIDALKTWDTDAYTRPGLTSASTTHSIKSGSAREFTQKVVATAVANVMNEGVGQMGMEDLTLVAAWEHFDSLGTITEFTSGDFVEKGAVGKGKVPEIYGMNVVLIDNASRRANYGRLDTNRAYVFARNAVGLAINEGERTGIMDWIADRQSYLIGACASFDATRVQNAGIIEIRLEA